MPKKEERTAVLVLNTLLINHINSIFSCDNMVTNVTTL